MPTGGKLIGALTFAFLAYFITDLVKPYLPEGTQVGLFSPINAFVGLLMGWTIMGKGAGASYRKALGYGVTTLAATAFWCILFWAGYDMLQKSLDLRYDGPIEALQEMARTFIDYAKFGTERTVLVAAVIGALFMGWVTEFFARRWS